MTPTDRIIRTVSDLRDLVHRLKAAPTRSLTPEERRWNSANPVVNEDALPYPSSHSYYPSVRDKGFLDTVNTWLDSRKELLVLIRFSRAAGQREFEFFSSLEAFLNRLQELPPLACITVFGQPQLPIRGVVDDTFIANCLSNFIDGSEYLIVETERQTAGPVSWFHHGSGLSRGSLREDLEESRGVPIAFGPYPPWLKDGPDVVSAIVPDEHGVVRTGIY